MIVGEQEQDEGRAVLNVAICSEEINILSLCTGAGGLDVGLGLALPGSRVICCVEHEAYAAAVLEARMEDQALDEAPIWSDLRTFDGRPWRGIVDGIIGGYPCQPFSCAGRRAGRDDPRHLWPAIARIIGEIEPGFCWFENVSAHLTLGFEDVRGELEGMGYRVAAGLWTAAEVGASHKRERLFILAVRADAGCGVLRESSGGDGQPDGSNAAVADANARNWRSESRPNQRAIPGWNQESVADAEVAGRGQYQPGQRADRGAAVVRAGEVVGDAEVSDWRAGESGESGESGERRRGPGGECAGMADAQGEGRQGGIAAGDGGADGRLAEYGLPLFAPGPADMDGWRRLLAIRPDLEPARLTGRMDLKVVEYQLRRALRCVVAGGNRAHRGRVAGVLARRIIESLWDAKTQSVFCGTPDGLGAGLDAHRLRLTGNGVVPLQAAYAFISLAAALFGGGD